MIERVQHFLPALIWLLLLAWAAWIYAPGLTGPSLLDDQKNLSRLELLSDNPEFATDVIQGNRSGPLGRPLSMASFVVEKLYFDNGLAGIKRTNLFLHLLLASLLYLLFRRLLQAAQLPEANWLALFAAALWLLSPLHISTVLYSVQRMTQLSALCCVLSLLAYLQWRLPGRFSFCRYCWLGVALLMWVCALFAKENALVLPLVILVMEWLWFGLGRATEAPARAVRKWLVYAVLFAIVAALVYLLTKGDWLLAGYGGRDFGMQERLLTQTRVLFHYIRQLLWPDPGFMGLFHDDYPVSRGLVTPWATLPALLFWLIVGAWMIRVPGAGYLRLGLAGLAIFVAGHALEASILPLELYFEHRNYLPSMGIYLSVAVLAGALLQRLPELRQGLVIVGSGLLFWFALSAGSQSVVWSSRELIVLGALDRHPQSTRVHTEMAVLHARYGELTDAWDWSDRAAELAGDPAGDSAVVRNLVLACLANRPLPDTYLQSLMIAPQQAQLRTVNNDFDTLLDQIQDGHCPRLQVEELADRLQQIFLVPGQSGAATSNLWTLLAQLENHLGRYDPAYRYVQLLLHKSPGDVRGLFMQMYFAAGLGRVTEMQEIRSRLQEMQADGLLDRQQQHNLALFDDAK